MAVAVGVDPQTIGRWERDERAIAARYHDALASTLGLEASDLGGASVEVSPAVAANAAELSRLADVVERLTGELERVAERVEECFRDQSPG